MKIKKLASVLKITFIAIVFMQLGVMLFMGLDVGISADENRHIQQAEKVYNFYKTKGEDKSALESTGIDPMQFNGQSFDNVMYLLTKTFKVKKYMEMRHFFNALLGWFIVLITGLIAKKFWGYKGAILAVVLLFISPRFLGHAMNNNKDIPFAFGFILSFYGILLFLRELPKIKITTILILIAGIAYAISIRLAGILSIGFLGLFSVIFYFIQKPIKRPFAKNKRKILVKFLIFIPIIIVAGYALGIIFWPYMIAAPISNFKVVLEAMSAHPVKLNQLFNGEIYQSDSLPSEYTIVYILYTYPLFVLAGMTAFVFLFPFRVKREEWVNQFAVFFAFVFVVVWMSLKNSNIYGGIRHLLFIYPLAIVLAVIGFRYLSELLSRSKYKLVQLTPFILLFLLALNPVKHIVKNYPYSYVYFNELSGGTQNAALNFETDYFQHSLKNATNWLINNELVKVGNNDTIKIATNDAFNVGYYINDTTNKINVEYTRYYDKYSKYWEYGIFYCDYIAPVQLKNKLWPPIGTIHTEDVDGFPIAAVVKRASFDDYKGFKALKENKVNEAKDYFTSYLALDPENEEVLEGMAQAYFMERNMDKVNELADSSLKSNPRQVGALYLKAASLNYLKKYDEALIFAQKCEDVQESLAEAFFQKGISLKYINRPNEAIAEFLAAIARKNDYYDAYMQIGEIYINYKKYNDAIEKMYSKALAIKENDFFATIFTAKCYHFLNNNAKAYEIINSIAQNQQNNFEVVKLKCRLDIDYRNYGEAARYLNMTRNIQTNSDLFLIRALYSYAVNNISLAETMAEKAVELDNLNNEAKEFLQKIRTSNTSANNSAVDKSQPSVMTKKEDSKNAKNKVDLFDFDK